MKKLIMLMITCIMITGCSATKTQETMEDVGKTSTQKDDNTSDKEEDNAVETVEEMPVLGDVDVNIAKEEEVLLPLSISTNTLENKYYENDAVIAHVKIDYPIIRNATQEEGLTKINQFFEESAEALYEENNTYASDNVEAMKEEFVDKDSEECYSEYLVTFEVKYNDFGYLSILENFSEYNYGMESPNIYSTGYVFQNKTGERLTIHDVLMGTDKEIAEIIGQTFISSDKISEEVKKNYKDEILASTQYAEFYIDDKNINFFYNPDTVAPYLKGTLEASIPLNTENIFKLTIK